MIPRLVTFVGACAISIGLIVTGCGGGSDDASSVTGSGSGNDTESQASYLGRANAACRKARVGLQKEVSEFVDLRQGEPHSPSWYADFAHYVLMPKIEDELEEVRELGAPPEAAEDLNIDYLLYLKEIPLNQIAISKTVASLEAVDRMFEKPGRILREKGLPSCARGPEAVRLAKRVGL